MVPCSSSQCLDTRQRARLQNIMYAVEQGAHLLMDLIARVEVCALLMAAPGVTCNLIRLHEIIIFA